ncbi:MAG: response regulator transcription factor [Scytonema sp. PMC 1069.18]|nr:response regulator transcription factor [Scytonema sp. PMC 1069.18]MEC4881153.1 response regulator transcription factor [Scytonema sp. PMC 1070.18]
MEILLVEDEPEIAQLIKLTLEREGFSTRHCNNGLAALEIFKQQQPDLIILDLMIPGLDGLEVCARIRQKLGEKDPYILMLTAKSEEIDRIVGLSTGADDYLTKPFSPKELVARVRALLRRSLRHIEQDLIYRSQHFIVNVNQRTASKKLESGEDQVLDLTTLEFNLLSTFISQPQRVWNRTQLIDKLWGDNFFGDERVVDTHVARLRKKIEPDPAHPTFVKTVTGVGYKFEDAT